MEESHDSGCGPETCTDRGLDRLWLRESEGLVGDYVCFSTSNTLLELTVVHHNSRFVFNEGLCSTAQVALELCNSATSTTQVLGL